MVTGLLWWTVTISSVILSFLLVGIWISVSMQFGSDPRDVASAGDVELMESIGNIFPSPSPVLRKTPPPRYHVGGNPFFSGPDI